MKTAKDFALAIAPLLHNSGIGDGPVVASWKLEGGADEAVQTAVLVDGEAEGFYSVPAIHFSTLYGVPAGKVRLSGRYPRVEGYGTVAPETRPTCTVSLERDLWKVARDVQRRFLTPYLASLPAVFAQVEERRRYAAAVAEVLTDFEKAIPGGRFSGVRLAGGGTIYGLSLEARVNSPDAVDLKIRTDPETAEAVIAVLKARGHFDG
jgi:hypothetical protein